MSRAAVAVVLNDENRCCWAIAAISDLNVISVCKRISQRVHWSSGMQIEVMDRFFLPRPIIEESGLTGKQKQGLRHFVLALPQSECGPAISDRTQQCISG